MCFKTSLVRKQNWNDENPMDKTTQRFDWESKEFQRYSYERISRVVAYDPAWGLVRCAYVVFKAGLSPAHFSIYAIQKILLHSQLQLYEATRWNDIKIN